MSMRWPKCVRVFIATAPSPILFHLTPHSGRRRVLELEPVRRPAGTILRSEPLGHDTLQPHQTGVAKHNFALLLHHPNLLGRRPAPPDRRDDLNAVRRV